MSEKTLKTRIQNKRGTTAEWATGTAPNFVPKDGEIVAYTDVHRIKIGDGTTKVSALPFVDNKFPENLIDGVLPAWNSTRKKFEDSYCRNTIDGLSVEGNIDMGSSEYSLKLDVQDGSFSYSNDGQATIKKYALPITKDSGTLALTSDIPSISNMVTTNIDQTITGHKTFSAGLTADTLATFNGSANFNEDLTLACPIVINNNAGTAGQVLTSQGEGATPIWSTVAYHIEVTSASGSITQEQFDALKADKGSYIVRKSGNYEYVYNFWQFTSTTVAADTALTYVNINGSTVYFLYIKNNLTFTTSVDWLQSASYRVSSITDFNKTSTLYYPSIAAVTDYFGRITKVTGASLSVYNLEAGLYEWTYTSNNSKTVYWTASKSFTIENTTNDITYVMVTKPASSVTSWVLWTREGVYQNQSGSAVHCIKEIVQTYDSSDQQFTCIPPNAYGSVSFLGEVDITGSISIGIYQSNSLVDAVTVSNVTDGDKIMITVKRGKNSCFFEAVHGTQRVFKLLTMEDGAGINLKLQQAGGNSFTYTYVVDRDLYENLQ